MKKVIFYSLLGLLMSCQNRPQENQEDLSVEFDSTFCSKLMPGLGGGITGGDGCISIDLKDGRSIFMWGDSFMGDVENGIRSDSSKFIIGNTFTIIDKDGKLETLYGGNLSNPSAFIPAEQVTGTYPTWYWPGNGFVEDGILHLFMSKLHKTGNNTFDFEYLACDYFRLDVKTMKVIDKTNFKAANENGVHYGHAILPCQDGIYIYGTKVEGFGVADVHIAKAQLVDGKLADFVYWDGAQWQSDPLKSRKLIGLDKSISEQFDVFPLDGKIVLLSQDRLEDVRKIYSYVADKPVGPFRNEQLLYTADEPDQKTDSMIIYNAMAHPQYKKGNKILVSYNVNTHDLDKVFKKASLYRPRFIWVPIKKILE